MLLVTNNPLVANRRGAMTIDFQDWDYGQVLLQVKDYIIKERMILLTHPLSGSIKPNETFYKSIVLAPGVTEAIDMTSLAYIENALAVYQGFMRNKMRPNWTEAVLKDFAYVDYYLMESTFERMQIR